MDKKEIRRAMKRQNLSLSAAERAARSARLFGRVEKRDDFFRARVVAFFSSLADEPDTTEALIRWSGFKRIVVPRVEGDVMQFYDYDPALMETGAFGIAEPQTAAACDPSEIDLIVVPGTAFTAGGARMGRGRGYYDKYMSRTGFRARKIGVCFAHQVLPELPVEPHDVMLDDIVTG